MRVNNPVTAGSHDVMRVGRMCSCVGSGVSRILSIVVISICVTTASGAFAAPNQTAAAPAGDLRGTWVLNPDLSDSPRQKLEAGDRAQPRPRTDAGPADEHERARTRDEMRHALEGPRRMTVEQEGNRVLVFEQERITQTFEADSRVYRAAGEGGGLIERYTRWDNGALVSDVMLPQGSYTQTWQRKGPLLTITTRFSHNRDGPPIVSTRVYEREARRSP